MLLESGNFTAKSWHCDRIRHRRRDAWLVRDSARLGAVLAFDLMNILSRLLAVVALLGSLAYGSYAVGRYVLSEKLFGTSVAVQPSSGIVAEGTTRVTKTRNPEIKSGKSSVEVTVLPAAQAGPGPDVSPLPNTAKKTPPRSSSISSDEKPKLVNANTLAASRSRLRYKRSSIGTITGESGVVEDDVRPTRRSRRLRRLRERAENADNNEESRPQRRRRKRRRRSATTTATADSPTTSTRSRRRSSEGSTSRRRESRPNSRSDDSPARSQSNDNSSGGSSSGGDSPVPLSF